MTKPSESSAPAADLTPVTPHGSERLAGWLRGFSRAQVLVLAVATVLLATAVVLVLQHRPAGAPANQALVDRGRTEGVSTVVSRALTQVLSFDHRQPEATKAMADEVLDGQARDEYDTLFASLEERAGDQKLMLSALVQVAALKQLTSDKAHLLVFLDQTSTREGDEESSVSAAQLDVRAERRGKTWVITGLTVL